MEENKNTENTAEKILGATDIPPEDTTSAEDGTTIAEIKGATPEVLPEEKGETSEDGATSEEDLKTSEELITEDNKKRKREVGKDKILTPKQKKMRFIKRMILMHIGILLMSTSVYFFQTPNKFTLGGVAGIAILLSNVVNHPFFTQAIFMIIINVFLLIIGLIILGKECTILTIYCSLLYTGLIALFEKTVPLEGPITDQPFLELCYAVLLFGVGGALIFNCGASSGGTDIIALILKKFTKMNVGVALMVIDLIVIIVSITQFQSIAIALYSFLGLFARTFLLDGVIENIGKTKYINIITTHPDEIGDYILDVIDHSYTRYEAEGGYTGEKKFVLITVCKRTEALKIKSRAKTIDPSAFIIITDAKEIIGKGFGDTL